MLDKWFNLQKNFSKYKKKNLKKNMDWYQQQLSITLSVVLLGIHFKEYINRVLGIFL